MYRDPKTGKVFSRTTLHDDEWSPPRLATSKVAVLVGEDYAVPERTEPKSWRTSQAFLEETLSLIAPLQELQGFEALFLIGIEDYEHSTITGNNDIVSSQLLDAVAAPLRLSPIRYVSVSCSRYDILLHRMVRDLNLVCALALNRAHGPFALAKMKLERICVG